jgi:hypothetical protein
MEQNAGNEILESVREVAMGIHKPFDIVYLRARSPLDRRFLESSIGRQHYRSYLSGIAYDDAFLRASDPVRLAILAADEVQGRGSKACLGRIDAKSVYHAFCVADYQPDDESPKRLGAMTFKDDTEAWVIDPWMNISCSFSDYPSKVKEKAVKWEMRGKRIISRDSIQIADVDEENISYIDATHFAGTLHYAPLFFDENVNRGAMTKSARRSALS